MAFEKTGLYRGTYHVLMGRVSPLDGVDPEHLTIDRLRERVQSGDVREVILATDPDADGDGTALYISKLLEGCDVQVTRIARGMPAGSSVQHVGTAVLADALRDRHELK
jgi:recombination protein RecR